MLMHIERVPVIHPRPAQIPVVDGEAERVDEVQPGASERAHPADIAGVLRNFGTEKITCSTAHRMAWSAYFTVKTGYLQPYLPVSHLDETFPRLRTSNCPMIILFLLRRWASLVCATALAVTTVLAASDRKPFTTASTLRLETSQLIMLLEQVHYNRDAVKPVDYAEVIPDYMGGLDGQRLFFLGSDKADFEKRYASSLYYNVHDLGNIDAAYDIFYTYDNRTQARVSWICEELKKDFDFAAPDFYRIDRSKSEWPQTMADADNSGASGSSSSC